MSASHRFPPAPCMEESSPGIISAGKPRAYRVRGGAVFGRKIADVGRPWDRVRNWWQTRVRDGDGGPSGEVSPDPPVDALVWQAQRELEAARAYFESVSDPDLVDHACYLLEAAQKRYSYVLRLARQSRLAG